MEYDTYFGDITTRYQRMGFSGLYRKIARTIVWSVLPVIIMCWLGTVIINLTTAQTEYRTALRTTIYLNTYGLK